MKILTNREVEIFDSAYALGFRAGQLAWRKRVIADNQRLMASVGGEMIATRRGNISLDEYDKLRRDKWRIEDDPSLVGKEKA